jgi:hypothetical protein
MTSVCIDILEKFLVESRKPNGHPAFRRDIVASGLDELQQNRPNPEAGQSSASTSFRDASPRRGKIISLEQEMVP